jgi:hypothetical protein
MPGVGLSPYGLPCSMSVSVHVIMRMSHDSSTYWSRTALATSWDPPGANGEAAPAAMNGRQQCR